MDVMNQLQVFLHIQASRATRTAVIRQDRDGRLKGGWSGGRMGVDVCFMKDLPSSLLVNALRFISHILNIKGAKWRTAYITCCINMDAYAGWGTARLNSTHDMI